MNTVKELLEKNKETYLSELFELLRIPSVSADSRHKEDVRNAATFIIKKLKEAGADHVELMETKGHPIIYGEKLGDSGKPTVLVYGHYDVQPPDHSSFGTLLLLNLPFVMETSMPVVLAMIRDRFICM